MRPIGPSDLATLLTKVAALLLALLLALATSAPSFAADPYASVLATTASSAADEYALGKEYLATQIWLAGELDDPEQQARVERILRRILAASDRPDQVYNVTLLASDQVNASALPGGFVMVNKGLLDLVDDDQLAFVLGHELSHVILRHGASAMNVQSASASALRSALDSGDRASVAEQSRQLYLLMASHSRQLELEADLYGLLYAVRAGYPSEASITALQALEASIGGDLTPEEVPWASHPLFSDRIEQLGIGVVSIKRTRAQFDAGLQWIQSGRYEEAVTTIQQFLTLFPHSQAGWSNLGAAYLYEAAQGSDDPWIDVLPLHADSGVAVRGNAALARDRARDALGHALQLDPTDPVALGLFGVLARTEGRLTEARQLLERAVAMNWLGEPVNAAALLVDLGNVAAQQGAGDEALSLWAKARAAEPGLAEPLVNAARWYESVGTKKSKKQAIEAWKVVLAEAPAWSDVAIDRLNTLGSKAVAPAAPTASAQERLTGSFGSFGVGDPLDAVTAKLGPPDLDLPADAGGDFRAVVWDAAGVAATIRSGRVLAWMIVAPSEAATGAGVRIGATRADVTRAYGEPTAQFTVGGLVALEWVDRGVAIGLAGDEVVEIDICAVAP